MKACPEISIVSPCYNHGKYVPEMVQSVLAQTFPDYELIIVNDGSTDNSKQLLDSLRHDNRIKILHQSNRGPSFARNTGIGEAKGPVILNLDADDKIAPSLLEKAHAILTERPEVGIVTSEAVFFGSRSGRFDLPPYSLDAMLRDNVIPSTGFFRKRDWCTVGGYSRAFPDGLEDYDFWLSLLRLGRKVHRIPEELIFYRVYPRLRDSRSGKRKSSRSRMTMAKLTLFQRHADLYGQCPEARESMMKLKRSWEKENALVGRLRDLRWHLMLMKRRLING